MHAFGHIHEGYGVFELEARTGQGATKMPTRFINASSATMAYKPTQKPVVVDFAGACTRVVAAGSG